MPYQFYGLLHFAENETSAVNCAVTSFNEQILIYLRNAISLSRSLRSRGISFIVLTNQKQEIERLLEQIGQPGILEIQELCFNMQLPHGLSFFSSHFKLEVYQYLASLDPQSYSLLIDLDVIAVNPLPRCFDYIVEHQVPLYYDISDQMIPAYSHDRLLTDIQKLMPNPSEGRWCGGEFIAGSPDFFSTLSTEVQKILDTYISQIDVLYHQGDELVTSVALEKMRQQGYVMADAGTLGIVWRYWSTPPLHPQKNLDYMKSCFLLHLPTDKKFLAELDEEAASNQAAFLKTYTTYHWQKRKRLSRQKKLSGVKGFVKQYLRPLRSNSAAI
ncbi:hypothetical protein H6F89_25930 [Cyanobacteria bacterium FACHB-63]|nr:hypothetical protein [Cyanobacteria bacterium FACHB-63]